MLLFLEVLFVGQAARRVQHGEGVVFSFPVGVYYVYLM